MVSEWLASPDVRYSYLQTQHKTRATKGCLYKVLSDLLLLPKDHYTVMRLLNIDID